MRILLAFASANALLRTFLAAKRAAVVPPEVTQKGYWRERNAVFDVQLQAIDQTTAPDSIGQWLRRVSKKADAVVLFLDEGLRYIAQDLEDAYFVVSVPTYPGKILQNQLGALLSPVLRHFAGYCTRFDSLRNQRMLLLPLDIFIAPELGRLRNRLTENKMVARLGEDLDAILSEINERARPKKKQQGKTVFLVDDRPLCYRYGPERHAFVQTVAPPHAEKCWHNSCYRFGRLYEDRLHHNVDSDSDPTRVDGQFINCHGVVLQATGQSHLNVFPNGYL